MTDEIDVKDHLDRDVQTICGYCGAAFADGEIVIERTIHGRVWKFCGEGCYHDFMDAIHFRDEDLDSYEAGAEVKVGEEDDLPPEPDA